MRLKSFSIKNFKGIGGDGVTIVFAPVTLLFGANNSGKSTIMQALHLAREIICNGNMNPDFVQGGGRAISLGGFQNFVHRHELHREISFKLEMEIDKLPEYYSDFDSEILRNEEYNVIVDSITSVAVTIGLAWDSLAGKPFVASYAMDLNKERFTQLKFSSSGTPAMFSGCNPVMLFSEQNRKDISKKLKTAYKKAESDEFEEAFAVVQATLDDVIPIFFRKFVDYSELLLSLDAKTDIAEDLLPRPASSVLHFSWADWNTLLDVDDINWWIPDSLFESEANTIDHIETTKTLFSSLILGPGALAAKALSQMEYISAVRATPDRHFVAESVVNTDWADGMAAWKALTEQPELLEQVNNELPLIMGKPNSEIAPAKGNPDNILLRHQVEGAFDLNNLSAQLANLIADGEDLDPARLRSMLAAYGSGLRNRLVFIDDQGTTTLPCDLGHGVSQIIPLIAAPLALGSSYTQRLIAIEEPESNIHPAWQVELAEFFLRVAARKDTETGIPPLILLETHSEHIMLRLLRRIRETSEGNLPEEATAATIHDVAVHYIQKDANDCTESLRMEVTPDGDFTRQWPKGFFEERIKEVF